MSSKPNCSVIVSAKIGSLVKIWQKYVKKAKKLDKFGVEIKDSNEYAIIQLLWLLWHFLQSCDTFQPKMSQTSDKNGQKKIKKNCYQGRVGFEPGTLWGLVSMI